jgi:excisionase family DNA binding protein
MQTKLLRPGEVAQRLAVSPLTIRKWIHLGQLPVVRLGRAVRIREEDIEAMIRLGYEPIASVRQRAR